MTATVIIGWEDVERCTGALGFAELIAPCSMRL
jgi:hypothetical protein